MSSHSRESLIDRVAGLGRVKHTGDGGYRVGSAGAGPAGEIEFVAGEELADGDTGERARNAGAASAGLASRFKEIDRAGAGDHPVSIGIEKKRGVLVDADGMDFPGVARL